MRDEHRQLFREGSTTYYNSSRFFPKQVRRDVFILYGFVRKADNYVDAVPQDREGFYTFRDAWAQAELGTPAGDPLIDLYVELSRRRRFEKAWTEAFLHAMELDLEKDSYNTIEETIEYMYGSAEVIGLFMCRIMELSDEALFHARMLGRAMQYINFIRDIDEDLSLGRRYLPLDGTPLKKLDRDYALSYPELFRQFHGQQIELYRRWQRDGEAGYHYIPWRYLVPIKTAADSYLWTARLIEKDPLIVFRRKVKPKKSQVLLRGLANMAAAAWIILKKGRKV